MVEVIAQLAMQWTWPGFISMLCLCFPLRKKLVQDAEKLKKHIAIMCERLGKSDVTWQWKKNLELPDEEATAWQTYPPEDGEAIERAHQANARSVELPPDFQIDLQTMQLRKAGSPPGAGATGTRPVRRVGRLALLKQKEAPAAAPAAGGSGGGT